MIELMTVIAVIAILAIMVFGVAADLQRRANRSRCVTNLKNLYAAANVYIQRHGSWPQVDYHLLKTGESAYAEAWITALRPCGVDRPNWICPTMQSELGDPDFAEPKNHRVDYIASPFDDRAVAPFEHANQPWFAERGDPHGDGNLVILTNGRVLSLRELFKSRP